MLAYSSHFLFWGLVRVVLVVLVVLVVILGQLLLEFRGDACNRPRFDEVGDLDPTIVVDTYGLPLRWNETNAGVIDLFDSRQKSFAVCELDEDERNEAVEPLGIGQQNEHHTCADVCTNLRGSIPFCRSAGYLAIANHSPNASVHIPLLQCQPPTRILVYSAVHVVILMHKHARKVGDHGPLNGGQLGKSGPILRETLLCKGTFWR